MIKFATALTVASNIAYAELVVGTYTSIDTPVSQYNFEWKTTTTLDDSLGYITKRDGDGNAD